MAITWILVVIFSDYISNCSADQAVTVSQDSFANALGRLVTSTHGALLKEIEELRPSLDSCTASVNSGIHVCSDCLQTLSCEGPHDPMDYINAVLNVDPAMIADSVEPGLDAAGQLLADAAQALFDLYGEDAVNVLIDGYNSIGGTVSGIVDGLQEGVDAGRAAIEAAEAAAKAAADAAKKAAESAWSRVSGWFGKRRRRSTSSSLLPKLSLPEISEEQKQCLGQCPECSHFLSGNVIQILRSVCGSSFGDKFETMYNKAVKLTALVKDWQSTATAKQVLLKEIWLDSSSYRITRVVFWMETQYITYYPTTDYFVSMFNHADMYPTVALWMLNNYMS